MTDFEDPQLQRILVSVRSLRDHNTDVRAPLPSWARPPPTRPSSVPFAASCALAAEARSARE